MVYAMLCFSRTPFQQSTATIRGAILSPLRASGRVLSPSHAFLSHPPRRAFSSRHLRSLKVHSSLESGGCISYSKSWAWQSVLLHQRLATRRQQQQLEPSSELQQRHEDDDCILLLEHFPVYTLGRGSNEGHLTFVNDSGNTASNNDEMRLHLEQEVQTKLSRTVRGPGTARLALDTESKQRIESLIKTNNSDQNNPSASQSVGEHNDISGIETLHATVQALSDGASPVVAPNGVPIYRVERGGEVTFHGPSQLVVYPMLDLQRQPYQADLHWYLRQIEEVVIQTLARYGIEGERDTDNTGVWVKDKKVAAVGISSSRWITTHGFAINIDPDLSFFDTSMILPCGIEGKGVTSMAATLLREHELVGEGAKNDAPVKLPTVKEVTDVVLECMGDIFDVSVEHGTPLR